MHHSLPLPPSFNPKVHDAGDLQRYLETRGYAVTSVTVTTDHLLVETPDEGVIAKAAYRAASTLNEDNTDGLADDLAAFAPQPSARQQLLDQLDVIDTNTGDVEDLRVAVTILKELVSIQ